MGVTYKLKPQVIAAIVQLKKDNPTISCRKMAEEIGQKYNVKISKSSINSILKNAQLSSSVGRRSKVEYPKKFQIPIVRKKQLKETIEKTGLDAHLEINKSMGQSSASEETKVTGSILDDISGEENKCPKSSEINKINPPPEVKKGEGEIATIEKIVEQDVSQEIKRIKNQKSSGWSRISPHMGGIFFLAANWEVGKDCKLAALIEKAQGKELSAEDRKACRIWFHFWVIGVKKYEDISANKEHAVWKCYLEEEEIADYLKRIEKLYKLLENNDLNIDLCRAAIQDLDRAFTLVNGFRIKYNGFHLAYLDSGLKGIDFSKNNYAQNVPVDHALTVVSRQLISNNEPLCFYRIPNNQNDLEKFYKFVSLINGDAGQKVENIAVIDTLGNEIASFDIFPKKKRIFIVGMYPKDKGYEKITERNKWAVKSEYIDKWNETIYTVSQVTTDAGDRESFLRGIDLRIITVESKVGNNQAVTLLTNDMMSNVNDIIRTYFNRYLIIEWFGHEKEGFYQKMDNLTQNHQNESPLSLLLNKSNEELIDLGIFGIMECYLRQVSLFCSQEYFGVSTGKNLPKDCITSIYGLSGQSFNYEDMYLIKLVLPENYSHKEVLSQAINRVNHRNIFTETGKKLLIEPFK